MRTKHRLPTKYAAGYLRDLDRRTATGKELAANFERVCEEAGGKSNLTHVKLCLIERFVFLEATLQNIELKIAGDPKHSAEFLSRWIQAVNSVQGLAKIIGIERSKKKSTDLKAYVAKRA